MFILFSGIWPLNILEQFFGILKLILKKRKLENNAPLHITLVLHIIKVESIMNLTHVPCLLVAPSYRTLPAY